MAIGSQCHPAATFVPATIVLNSRIGNCGLEGWVTALLEKLKVELIRYPYRVYVVAGIGVSLAACGDSPCATWKGLLEHGLERCRSVCYTDANLLDSQLSIVKNPASPTHALIGVGQFITEELSSKHTGAFGAWLEASIGQIVHKTSALSQAIASLDVRIATTNYDAMLEIGTNRTPITWRNHALANNFFRNESNDILHLHGYYREPESIVLGAKSYEQVCSDETVQTLLRGAMTLQTFLFVGCGAGLEDPNFATLLDWTRQVLKTSTHTHFILVKRGDIATWCDKLQGLPIQPLPYGDSYSDLTPFLQSLAKEVSQSRNSGQLPGLIGLQKEFDATWQQLKSTATVGTSLLFFQKSQSVAEKLREAGGHRRAAMEFSQMVVTKGGELEPVHFAMFSLNAAEWLLEEDLPGDALRHILHIEDKCNTDSLPPEVNSRLQSVRLQVLDSLCDLDGADAAAKLALGSTDESIRLNTWAARSEINYLRGSFEAALNSGPGAPQ